MTPATSVDSSVLVAALASWHENHDEARTALEKAMGPAGELVLPADVLVETYSVLTRLPSPHRLSPVDALRLLEENLADARTVALAATETWRLLRTLAVNAVTGGAVYDARIVAAAVKGGAARILTLNGRHFSRLAPDGLEVVVPQP
ncbi:MAG TPA: PIN domain-containing protein [Thermoanaerobaculia bacterium]|nr:PIN domain-containing protein [Thermoanaerobaculia bacterium]